MDDHPLASRPAVAPSVGTSVAVFDVDGTLTRRDTLLPFLALLRGRTAVARALTSQGLPLAAALAGHGSRDAVKQAVLGALLEGMDAAQVEATGTAFAGTVLCELLRPDSLARLRWHQAKGHQVVLLSASLADYLEPLGARLGVDAVLSSRLEVDAGGKVTGRLLGGNCRGPEKVVRLQTWLAGTTPFVWAYGDSAGDRQLLSAADRPTLLRRRVRMTEVPNDRDGPDSAPGKEMM